jgi:hypothetical protein
MEFFLIWVCIGLAGFILCYVYDTVSDDVFKFVLVLALLGGPIFAIWAVNALYQDIINSRRYKAIEKEKQIKVKQKKEQALAEYPIIFQKIEKDFNLIKVDNSKLTKKFFDDIRKILGYCSTLNKNELTETKMLREILIFARLNVLQFYEANNIKNAESLSKKINTILRKIK